ncbi:DUF6049 family protein [Pseudoclavibacter sp. CFCC 13611]|uniref:DUF6049 family protein n=1 Tax=Pseudoclavibacter sp. CFCC 13611 TaxID=2615178 RepID=UPI0013012858|nr:DUF6049 family protein [Pseudoclavibacter sp. CFCC 13611]KAB1662967.1 hypothetical protein F8O08_10485 [Pseudoclavibacter sp. CFCC 13611]
MHAERRGRSAGQSSAPLRPAPAAAPVRRLGAIGGILLSGALLFTATAPAAHATATSPAASATADVTTASAVTPAGRDKATTQPTRVSASDVQLSIDHPPRALDAHSPLSITATVTNNGDEPLVSAMVEFYLGNRLMTTTTQVRDWYDTASATGPSNRATKVGGRPMQTIEPGTSATVTFDADADRLPTWQFADDKGVLGYAVRLTSNSSDSVWQQSTLAWNVAQSDVRPLNVIVPITAPVAAGRFYTAEQLAQLTGADGELTTQIDALDSLNVQLAVDPKILASIALLGTSAPADALAWKQRLDAFPEIMPLIWSDADVQALSAAGVSQIGDDLLGGGVAGSTDQPLVLAQAPGDLSASGLSVVSGQRPLIISTDRLQDTSADVSLRRLQGTPVIGANHNLIDALHDSLESDGAQQQRDLDRITAMATTLGLATQDFSTVTTVLPRGWSQQAKQAGDALRSVAGSGVRFQPGVQITPHHDAQNGGDTGDQSDGHDAPQTDLDTSSQTAEQDDLSPLGELAQAASSVDRLASVSADPQSVHSTFLQQTASLCGAGWTRNDTWRQAVTAQAAESAAQLDAVAITSTTNLTLVSGSSQIPVAVRNDTGQPVTVQVHISPSTGRVTTKSPVSLTIDPHSAATAQVPVRAIANGSVVLNIGITNDHGDPIGETVSRPMDVQAQWEGIGLGIVGAAVTLLFGFGLVRSLIRRRHRLSADGEPPAEHPDHTTETPTR